LTPEQRARAVIDRQLAASGWLVCDRSGMDLVNHSGVAVREVHLGEAGRADYLLYVERRLVDSSGPRQLWRNDRFSGSSGVDMESAW